MEKEVQITTEKSLIDGTLNVPEKARGIVLFAHGSGSGRLSSRNRFVAQKMQESGFATLLMDLLTKEEEVIDERTRQFRFDIYLLARRLVDCTKWLKTQNEVATLPIFYFGASTGAAAALMAAGDLGSEVKAVVSRGGRPDLAASRFDDVHAATLLIVGGNDFGVIELNESAFNALSCEKELAIIKGATHLFEEPGTLEQVAEHAVGWFTKHRCS